MLKRHSSEPIPVGVSNTLEQLDLVTPPALVAPASLCVQFRSVNLTASTGPGNGFSAPKLER